MKTLKVLGLLVSFVSITIFLIFIMQTVVKEVDSPILVFIGSVLFIGLELMNGLSHGKLISRLDE